MKTDELRFKTETEVRKEYINISKNKRKLVQKVYWNITMFINGNPINEEQVFEPDIFFGSIEHEGKHPMFNCTCGIFGCGGYYVDVTHKKDFVKWIVEKDISEKDIVKGQRTILFSWDQLLGPAGKLIQYLEEVNSKLAENNYKACFNTDEYLRIVEGKKKSK